MNAIHGTVAEHVEALSNASTKSDALNTDLLRLLRDATATQSTCAPEAVLESVLEGLQKAQWKAYELSGELSDISEDAEELLAG